jgi:hypothetical protein
MISDDSDATSDANLQSRQNTLADIITTQNLFLISIKLFWTYVQEASAGGLDIQRQERICSMHLKRCFGFQLSGTWWRRWII